MKVKAAGLLSLSVFLITVTTSLAAEKEDECHIVMPSGEKVDLSGLCQSPSSEKSNSNLDNNNHNLNQRVVYGEQEPATPIEQIPKSKTQALQRLRERQLEQKRVFQEYSQYKKYIEYYRKNSNN